jgi:hypothetical protein
MILNQKIHHNLKIVLCFTCCKYKLGNLRVELGSQDSNPLLFPFVTLVLEVQ